MSRNIEIKAYISSVETLKPLAVAISDKGPIEIEQDDTFFHCDSGQIKLRAFSHNDGELIYYRRANQFGPKESFYLRSRTSAPESMRDSLSQAYGQVGRVIKHRTLYLAGRTRIHLDIVQDLGHFLELEVVLADHESTEIGVHEANELMIKLGINSTQLIDCAYVELLARKRT